VGPAVFVDAHRGAQVDVVLLEALGAHLHPPVEVVGLPLLEGALQAAVLLGEVDVVGDAILVVRCCLMGQVLSQFEDGGGGLAVRP
jgi:hypothetical protein